MLYLIVDPQTLGKEMVEVRARRGQSMRDVASVSGVSLSTIVCLEMGSRQKIRASVLFALLGAYPWITKHVTPFRRSYDALPAS